MNCPLIFERIYKKEKIVHSIVTPVYNQENIIEKNVKSYIDNTFDFFEIIIILDSCSDKTKHNLLHFINNYKNDNYNFIQIKILESSEPLFETKCDNIGFKLAEGEYILEIQADMEMTEKGYNKQLVKPFDILPNVIAVSGRCAHNLFRSGGIGKLGRDIEKNIKELSVDRNIFYTFETCNRGPLLLHKKKVVELGYLDEINYFLDNSEHDLLARAYLQYGYICGYVPIDFHAPLKNGSTRKSKDKKNIMKLKELKNKINKSFIDKYKNEWTNIEPKQYKLQ
jgi:glycosyltransferase involved in cell wall biosynthesis